MFNTHQLGSSEKGKIIQSIKHFLEGTEEVVFAYLHGSFIDANYFKDIDLAIYTKSNNTMKFESKVESKLSFEISKITNFECDVRIINNASIQFQYAVLKGRLLLCRDKDSLYNFKEKTYFKYLDFQPIREYYFEK